MHRGNDTRVRAKKNRKSFVLCYGIRASSSRAHNYLEPRYILRKTTRKNQKKLKVNREVQRKQKRTQLNSKQQYAKVSLQYNTKNDEKNKGQRVHLRRVRSCNPRWHHFIKHRVLDFHFQLMEKSILCKVS